MYNSGVLPLTLGGCTELISGCSAVGSAPALGACPAVTAEILQKSRKAFTYADFRGFKKTQKCVDFEFDHSLSHFHARRPKFNIISGCGAVDSAGDLGSSGRGFESRHSDQKRGCLAFVRQSRFYHFKSAIIPSGKILSNLEAIRDPFCRSSKIL